MKIENFCENRKLLFECVFEKEKEREKGRKRGDVLCQYTAEHFELLLLSKTSPLEVLKCSLVYTQ